ncbi:MAG TPA: ATP-binding cassette domain-containing protein [Streptosporangiales bacterium]
MTPYLAADRLALLREGAWVFRGVDLEADRGRLVGVTGHPSSAHTRLLLCLAGRMRPSSGVITLAGRPASPDTLRRHVGVGAVSSVSDLEDALRVGELLRERAAFEGRWRRRRGLVDGLLARVGLYVPPKTLVRDLDAAQRVRLAVASALVGAPDAVVVDGADRGVPARERPGIWRLLRGIADDGVAVVAAGVDAPAAAAHADLVVPVGVEPAVESYA